MTEVNEKVTRQSTSPTQSTSNYTYHDKHNTTLIYHSKGNFQMHSSSAYEKHDKEKQ